MRVNTYSKDGLTVLYEAFGNESATRGDMSEAPVKQHEYDLDTSWMQKMGEWGTRAEPGKRGLTLAELQVGSYGEVPEITRNMTGRPRGAGERRAAYRVGASGGGSKYEM